MNNIQDIIENPYNILWICNSDGHITFLLGGKSIEFNNFSLNNSIYEILLGSENFFENLHLVYQAKIKQEITYTFYNNIFKACLIPMENEQIMGLCSLEQKKEVVDEQSKKDYFATIYHEIRTPLTGITGLLYLIQNTHNKSLLVKYINIIEKSVDHLLELVNNLLDFSLIEKKQIILTDQPFNLYNLVNDCCILFHSNALKKSITVKLNISEKYHKLYLLGDAKRITQVINNLLNNAIKFTPVDGNISIKVFEEHDRIHFHIVDSGEGISLINSKKLFIPYSQISFQSDTGLGLSICKNLIELMNGSIGYQNNPSLFWFDIPLKETETTENVVKKQSKLHSKILVVEDDNISNFVLCKYLRHLGFFNIISQKNGKEVLNTLCDSVENNDTFNYVLLDNKMPYKSGLDISRDFLPLKTHEIFILVSGEQQDLQTIHKYGIDQVILKPYTIKDIENILK
jgi:signal transduction histidine kinase